MEAAYLFGVTFQLSPTNVELSPDRFETTMAIPAPEPGVPGWLFFRDRLWRGAVGDTRSMKRLASNRLDVTVVEISFAELRTDAAYLSALTDAIEADLDAFNADTVEEVLTKYLGSSIHVRD